MGTVVAEGVLDRHEPTALAMTARKQRHCEARSAVAIQGGGCVVTVVAMAMALWIATAFQASR